MKISLIAAMTRARVIGVDNKLPWNLPADLKRFRALTLGHPVLMGRKTLDSIGQPLPKRRNIVITRQEDLHRDGVEIVHSLAEGLGLCRESPVDEIFIIGGAQIFEEALPLADRLYITWIEKDIPGDAYFPTIPLERFSESLREDFLDEELPHSYVNYEKKTLVLTT